MEYSFYLLQILLFLYHDKFLSCSKSEKQICQYNPSSLFSQAIKNELCNTPGRRKGFKSISRLLAWPRSLDELNHRGINDLTLSFFLVCISTLFLSHSWEKKLKRELLIIVAAAGGGEERYSK